MTHLKKSEDTAEASQHAWKTWGNRHISTPSRVFKPRTLSDLQKFVAYCASTDQRFKVVGASKSSSAIAQPTETMMSLEYLTGVVDVDTDQSTATFLAGTTVRDANRILLSYNLAFENLGRLDQQTLAGAVSTGTHGTGLGFGGFSTQVTSLKLITATGDLLECSETSHPEIFRASLVGLGALGVLVSLTFRVVPLFRLHASERGRHYSDIVPVFEDRSRGADHYEFSWFPGSKEVRTRRLTRLPLLTEGYMAPHARLSQARRHGGDYVLNNGVFEIMNIVGATLPPSQGMLNKVSNWGKGNRRYADLAPSVFGQNRTVHQNNMEYAFDIAEFQAVMKDVRAHLSEEKIQTGFPLVVRTSAADDIPLSPAFGRETVYISAREYWRRPFEEYFEGLEKIFMHHGGRPHWGQIHTQDAAQLRKLYPEFEIFTALRQEMDPQGIFLNPYLEKVLIG